MNVGGDYMELKSRENVDVLISIYGLLFEFYEFELWMLKDVNKDLR